MTIDLRGRHPIVVEASGGIGAAMEALARGLAPERAPVRVGAVSPGLVDTGLRRGMAEADRATTFKRAAKRLPARGVGRPEDVARAIPFVATNPDVTRTAVTMDAAATVA